MPKKIAKSRRPQAERAAEWVLREVFGCVATRRALRTTYAKVDFFACDVIGVQPDGRRIWVQVTAGQLSAVTARRKKIEKYPWHDSDKVYVWQLVERPDPASPARKEWFFRPWEYSIHPCPPRHWWKIDKAIPVKREWFKAYKEPADA